ncbi:hypothetical protein [Ralstonia solanacearum]|uniref:Uncharacterized protein n=1 Tax=Ralstonia solanacearum CFBP2957 TaxID=859656 RepID=D8P643_RALSL|nr:hypothetical protein [Ralstonia solanacearum]MDB0529191.1 hypothetical protein [Ralstonia solanacearum]CBJ54379.1 protein of unknown function [Ralstonia solanacearum CFBP2957]
MPYSTPRINLIYQAPNNEPAVCRYRRVVTGGATLESRVIVQIESQTGDERTIKFRLGGDNLIRDEKGNRRVSFENYAIAPVDELEMPMNEGRASPSATEGRNASVAR